MTNYYSDRYETYQGRNLTKEIVEKANRVLGDSRVSNVAGIFGAFIPIVMVVL